MKNRRITLHDGTTATINDDDWRSVVNVKEFDETRTEIIRLTRKNYDGTLLLYVMRAAGGKEAEAEHREAIMMGADPKPAIIRGAQACGISDETLQQALATL